MTSLVVAIGFLASLPETFAEPGADKAARVVFARDVAPIISSKCYHCHGQDDESRKAKLRLDLRDDAVRDRDGFRAIVPGNAAESELLVRILSKDPDEVMPPPKEGHAVTENEIAILKRWIEEGAEYGQHWSFSPPVAGAIPAAQTPAFTVRTPVDAFITKSLQANGLKQNPEADKFVLLRRLALDLTGLPPSAAEIEEFRKDRDGSAYERAVDRYLASPRYGEKWARMWLDLARYADSTGYGMDVPRLNIWPYRDWVIRALNANLPYDQFTTEQLAGDLLPNPTLDQQIATAFHRNTMTQNEGGTNDEEYRVAAVKDRVGTTMQVWMGLTANCAQCHSHKFDPITHEEYYQLYAIFNQTEDSDRQDEAPLLPLPIPEQSARESVLKAEIAQLDAQLQKETPEFITAFESWQLEQRNRLAAPPAPVKTGRYIRLSHSAPGTFIHLAEVEVFSQGKNVSQKGTPTQSTTGYGGDAKRAADGRTDGDFGNGSVSHTADGDPAPWWELDFGMELPIERIVVWSRTPEAMLQRHAGLQVELLSAKREPVFTATLPDSPKPAEKFVVGGGPDEIPAPLVDALRRTGKPLTGEEVAKLKSYYRDRAPLLESVRNQLKGKKKALAATKPLSVPVMREKTRDFRKNAVLMKGNFLSPGKTVRPALLGSFHPAPAGEANRLTLAKWIVDPQNPFTARVAVNRFWAQLFGVGIVETEEDFGTQGAWPSHPELLDWLAVRFQTPKEAGGLGWDMKALLRLLVTSHTYRQSALVSNTAAETDPKNRFLSHFPRRRLDAETLRDQALALSGLLSAKIGGPSVYPPQPDGLWTIAFRGEEKYPTSTGEDRWRRGIYTFWRRIAPNPTMATFDAPSRETCTVRRVPTNTPLQAFVTLNDPVYVEAAQALARRILREAPSPATDLSRAKWALELVLARPASERNAQVLVDLLKTERTGFTADPLSAAKLSASSGLPLPKEMPVDELAAWTVIANVLLNLDGLLSRS